MMLRVWLCCLCMLPVIGHAEYQENKEVQAFVDRLVEEHKFDRKQLLSVFAEAEKKQSILDAISRPAEKRLVWHEYRKIFLTEKRITRGKEFIKKHRETLMAAEEKFGVPVEVITAILGVETWYGGYKGKYRVVDALATLAFDYPPRSKFFTKELEQVFLLAREQNFNVLELTGSYAGAMGYGQFIPSSYRHYAIDFDGDGVADILNNVEDAIGSVANYFVKHKWQPGKIVARKLPAAVEVPEELLFKGLKPKHTLSYLVNNGVPMQADLDGSIKAKLLELQVEDGVEQWVTFDNFYAITRYNHSHLYAMAVYQLSQALVQE